MRRGSPRSGCSILMTSAPKSANMRPANGPAINVPSSRTLRSPRGPIRHHCPAMLDTDPAYGPSLERSRSDVTLAAAIVDNRPVTDRYAVIGNPIRHSKSPEIHRAFAREAGEDIEYTADRVSAGRVQRCGTNVSGGRGSRTERDGPVQGRGVSARRAAQRAGGDRGIGEHASVRRTDGARRQLRRRRADSRPAGEPRPSHRGNARPSAGSGRRCARPAPAAARRTPGRAGHRQPLRRQGSGGRRAGRAWAAGARWRIRRDRRRQPSSW